MSTIHETIAAGRRTLRDAGLTQAEATLDARLLAQHALGWDASALLACGLEPAGQEFVDRFGSLLNRRGTREPLAYIVGKRDFWHLTIAVTPSVLIPRPETELLVEAALQRLPAGIETTVADVCTGSGCVAVALAVERPELLVVATDISEPALAVAASNVRAYGVEERVRLVRTDILSGITEKFDLIVANPPYVPTGERAGMQPEVRDFEPALALFGGDDGLDVVRALVEHATVRLSPGGVLLFEFGAGQERGVRQLMVEVSPLTMIEVRKDLQGIPRIAVAQLPMSPSRSQ